MKYLLRVDSEHRAVRVHFEINSRLKFTMFALQLFWLIGYRLSDLFVLHRGLSSAVWFAKLCVQGCAKKLVPDCESSSAQLQPDWAGRPMTEWCIKQSLFYAQLCTCFYMSPKIFLRLYFKRTEVQLFVFHIMDCFLMLLQGTLY